jgi:hypothetical protein
LEAVSGHLTGARLRVHSAWRTHSPIPQSALREALHLKSAYRQGHISAHTDAELAVVDG